MSPPTDPTATAAPANDRRAGRVLAIAVALVTLIVALYAQTGGHDYLTYDDDLFVTRNPIVKQGLTAEGVRWSMTSTEAAQWYPLTWLSHMLDVELFGVNAGPHHLVNVTLHALNTVLLLVTLCWMTSRLWASALVAALFAVHPMQVEPVAWIAERKGLLAGLFWMLTLLSYTWYATRPALGRYLCVALAIGLGMMCKATLMTAPFALLLLDIWPLRRWRAARPPRDTEADDAARDGERDAVSKPNHMLILEKLPLLAVTMAAVGATLLVRQAESVTSPLPWSTRLSNAVINYALMLRKAVWPSDLAIPYPARTEIDATALSVSAVVLAVVLAAALLVRRRLPAATVGVLWFLGTILPTIGVVQISTHAYADRYAYVPYIGLFVAAAWALLAIDRRFAYGRRVAVTLATVALLALSAATWGRVGHWRDSTTLFAQTLRVIPDNYLAHMHLGTAALNSGELERAKEHCRVVLRTRPKKALAWQNLGAAHARLGEFDEAESAYREAIAHADGKPKVLATLNLARLMHQQRRLDDAAPLYRQVIDAEELSLQPMALTSLAYLHQMRGDLGGAERLYRRSLDLDPSQEIVFDRLGQIASQQDRWQDAADAYRASLDLSPGDPDTLFGYGEALRQLGLTTEAAEALRRSVEIDPEVLEHRVALGEVELQMGMAGRAVETFVRCVEIDASSVALRVRLAAALMAAGRSGDAVTHLRHATELSPDRPDLFDQLGVALARVERFAEARAAFEQALSIRPDYEPARQHLDVLDQR